MYLSKPLLTFAWLEAVKKIEGRKAVLTPPILLLYNSLPIDTAVLLDHVIWRLLMRSWILSTEYVP